MLGTANHTNNRVVKNVGASDPAIIGAVVSVNSKEGATAAVAAAAKVVNNIGAPSIPPRW